MQWLKTVLLLQIHVDVYRFNHIYQDRTAPSCSVTATKHFPQIDVSGH